MSKLPVIDAKSLEKLLLMLGFKLVRQKGSHRFYRQMMADIQRYLTTETTTLADH